MHERTAVTGAGPSAATGLHVSGLSTGLLGTGQTVEGEPPSTPPPLYILLILTKRRGTWGKGEGLREAV